MNVNMANPFSDSLPMTGMRLNRVLGNHDGITIRKKGFQYLHAGHGNPLLAILLQARVSWGGFGPMT
jgi:hypothetical protein